MGSDPIRAGWMIEQKNREEFEQLGSRQVVRTIDAALYDAEKQKQAYEWLDEKENAHERAYKSRVFYVQLFNSGVAVLALIISLIALLKK